MTIKTSNLADKAMLASLSIHQWSAKKHDKKVSQEVATNHGSNVNMGRYNKSLIAKDALKEITKIAGAARNQFYELTLPWKDDGSRILTSAAYLKLQERIRENRQAFYEAKDRFIANYPSLIEDAKTSLNGLFNPEDYPSVSEIETKFRFAFHIDPLPIAGDFRVNLSNTDVALIQQQITSALNESVKSAMKDVWRRMQAVVGHMATSLQEYKVTASGKVENAFRDSLVGNIKDLLDIIPALNLTDDINVSEFAKDMEALVKYSANTLRDNDGTREEIARQASAIAAKMEAFV